MATSTMSSARSGAPRAVIGFVAIAAVLGGWLVFDGVRRWVVGDFVRVDGELGPWAGLVERVGLDPMALAPVFVALGSALLVAAALLLLRRRWGRRLGLGASAVALLYVGFGTPLAIAALVLLARRTTRAYAGG